MTQERTTATISDTLSRWRYIILWEEKKKKRVSIVIIVIITMIIYGGINTILYHITTARTRTRVVQKKRTADRRDGHFSNNIPVACSPFASRTPRTLRPLPRPHRHLIFWRRRRPSWYRTRWYGQMYRVFRISCDSVDLRGKRFFF